MGRAGSVSDGAGGRRTPSLTLPARLVLTCRHELDPRQDGAGGRIQALHRHVDLASFHVVGGQDDFHAFARGAELLDLVARFALHDKLLPALFGVAVDEIQPQDARRPHGYGQLEAYCLWVGPAMRPSCRLRPSVEVRPLYELVAVAGSELRF